MTGVLVSVSGSVGTAGCRFFCWDGEGRQRKVASLRGGTPSGDTTRAAGDGVIAAGSAV